MKKFILFACLPFLAGWPSFSAPPAEGPVSVKQSLSPRDCLTVWAALDPDLQITNLDEQVRADLSSHEQQKIAEYDAKCRYQGDALALLKSDLSAEQIVALAGAWRDVTRERHERRFAGWLAALFVPLLALLLIVQLVAVGLIQIRRQRAAKQAGTPHDPGPDRGG